MICIQIVDAKKDKNKDKNNKKDKKNKNKNNGEDTNTNKEKEKEEEEEINKEVETGETNKAAKVKEEIEEKSSVLDNSYAVFVKSVVDKNANCVECEVEDFFFNCMDNGS